ncbi:MarR family transcriptional regulator [Sinorhizobium numidicum]|uniref:MarR family transcriptional regulator n=1 Tax=Sinorhizobium numidicum TaxID=680248 RepID=A0ABY8CMH7_9HYPH|nr:MarR family transcriptional regulator [Sinorhizobium numidicum]WEX73878.1 MarR family transcriptional regulator [Sinorhizobium numidicum]WEX79863.1 MarR family transcriptional regulator [Sinorhizobium numidicum]
MLDANKLGALGTLISDRLDVALEGLSPSAAALLSMLHFKPGLTASRLAKIAGVSQPTAVRLIDGLERQQLVVRGKPTGRVTPLLLTEAGRARAILLQQRRLETLDTLLSPLVPEERRRFEQALDRILAGTTTSRAFARVTCRLCEHDLCGPDVCPIGGRASELERREAEADNHQGDR